MLSEPRIAVIVATIPKRRKMLERCLASCVGFDEIHVALDSKLQGAPKTRNHIAEAVTPECDWLITIDDDDFFEPNAAERYREAIKKHPLADVIYSHWYSEDVPYLDCFREFDAEELRKDNYIPATALVRVSTFDYVSGYPVPQESKDWMHMECGEDWGLWLRILDVGGIFASWPEKLWHWHAGSTTFHTKGMPGDKVWQMGW